MESFADLLTDAFSETSVPTFPDGDLDFENLNFDEKCEEEDDRENLTTKKDGALLQEATGETTSLFDEETKDVLYMAENDAKECDDNSAEEDYNGVGVSLMSKIPEEDYTSSDGDSEQEGSVSGEDEDDEEEDVETAEEPGDLLMSVCCSDEFYHGIKEDRIFAEGEPPAPWGAENPQIRNKGQGEAESEEEVSYFGRVPERGDETMIKGAGTEEDEQEREDEKQEDSSDPECEGMKIKQEEHVLSQCFEQEVKNPYGDDPAKASLEFPCISAQNLQDLVVEVEGDEHVDKMKDFSGEEHQEAGESFADYPSDFSSYEYIEDEGTNQDSEHKSNTLPRTSESGSNVQGNTSLAVTDITWMGHAEDTDKKEDEYLYSRDLEMDADKLMSLDVIAGEQDRGMTEIGCDDSGETGESDSYSSSDDEVQVRRNREDLLDDMCAQDLENSEQLDDGHLHGGSGAAISRWSSSDDHHSTCNRAGPADFLRWDVHVLESDSPLSEHLLTTEDEAETLPSEAVNSYSVVQRQDTKTSSPSYQGSLDDSFFFSTELKASQVTELGQVGDDEYEEERNWEQEQERIKAFYRFYDDSDEENGREGRPIKVQFCADPLSQVIHYKTDSSDTDSVSSSTDKEEDLSSSETSEELREPDDTMQMKPACDPPNTDLSESEQDFCNTPTRTGDHKGHNMLKLMLKLGLVMVMGLLMFWLATDQADWLSHVFFF